MKNNIPWEKAKETAYNCACCKADLKCKVKRFYLAKMSMVE